MNKNYVMAGVGIVIFLITLVTGVRIARGMPQAIEAEPWKVKGNPQASVFIVEFSDFACPYCDKIRPALEEVLKAFPNDVKLVFKHFPLSIHPPAPMAAEAAECAADQGKFWEYHDLLFDVENRKQWYPSKDLPGLFTQYAEKLQLNTATFRQCLESGAKKEIVRRNKDEGRKMFVSGTPTCLLNGRKVFTSHKPEVMKELIRKEIEKEKS